MNEKKATILRKEFTAKPNDFGQIEGYASTWDKEPDSYGDIVARGAFTETLKEWKASGRPIPFLWAHRMDDLDSFLGKAEANEDERGLHFVATFDDTATAQRVRQLYTDGRLAKFSFAYEVLDAERVTLPDGTEANELRKLRLYEISAVTIPANSHAEVTDVKHAQEAQEAAADAPEAEENTTPTGEKNGTEAEKTADADKTAEAVQQLRDAIQKATQLLETLQPVDNNEKATEAETEEPDGANAERKAALLDMIRNL